MSTVVCVHGTFASPSPDDAAKNGAATDVYWWQDNSAFATQMQTMVSGVAADGSATPLTVEPFNWSGNNSEVERREASLALLARVSELEERGEAYCLVGHSHGGSVIASMLLAAASHGIKLDGLRRWITVGTPFIGMRPLPRLLERLRLAQRVVLVASLMLFIMFIVNVIGQWFFSGKSFSKAMDDALTWRDAIATLMTIIPAVFVTLIFSYFDRKQLRFYRRYIVVRAAQTFGPSWLSLTHKNDEAVQGLRSMQSATLQIFDPSFARQRLTYLAVVALPVAYLMLIFSPPLMVSLSRFLQNNVYHTTQYAAVGQTYDAQRKAIRQTVAAPRVQSQAKGPSTAQPDSRVLQAARQRRETLKAQYPDYVAIERSLRYRNQFLEQNGKPCPNDTLCGQGHDIALNAQLLFFIATDETTSALINDGTRFGIYSEALRAVIPMVLVPLAFIAAALLVMLVIGALSAIVSRVLARALNRITLAEIKREVYGNDTDGEMALGAGPSPAWMPQGRPFLPPAIASLLADQADRAAFASLSKFRNAISSIAMSDGHAPSSGIVSTYLTWKELIHSSYFDLPEFRVLLARAIAAEHGFAATDALRAAPCYEDAGSWLQVVDKADDAKTAPMPLIAPVGSPSGTPSPAGVR